MSLIKLIKIKVSQDYGWKTMMQDSDIRRVRAKKDLQRPLIICPYGEK